MEGMRVWRGTFRIGPTLQASQRMVQIAMNAKFTRCECYSEENGYRPCKRRFVLSVSCNVMAPSSLEALIGCEREPALWAGASTKDSLVARRAG